MDASNTDGPQLLESLERRLLRCLRLLLIVMGTHGRGPITHALMGSVAEKVVRSAPCPVLTIRHPTQRRIAIDRLLGAPATAGGT